MITVVIPSEERTDPYHQQLPYVTFTNKKYGEHADDVRQHIAINFQTEVTDAEVVRRRANVWLLTHVGNLLRAENPELLLDNPLQWRFDIRLTLPDADMSHPFVTGVIGRICFNALTGKSMVPASQIDDFINELQSYAEKLVTH